MRQRLRPREALFAPRRFGELRRSLGGGEIASPRPAKRERVGWSAASTERRRQNAPRCREGDEVERLEGLKNRTIRIPEYRDVEKSIGARFLDQSSREDRSGVGKRACARCGTLGVVPAAGVAQLVEQLIRNQQVTRSSRVAGSKNTKKYALYRHNRDRAFGLANHIATTREGLDFSRRRELIRCHIDFKE